MAAPMTPPDAAPDFLAAIGWEGATIEPLAGDASFRRYFRITQGSRRAVLMDAPPPHEDPRPFVAVAEWLESIGLNAPTILGRDLERGLLLLGDLGSDRLRETLAYALVLGCLQRQTFTSSLSTRARYWWFCRYWAASAARSARSCS